MLFSSILKYVWRKFVSTSLTYSKIMLYLIALQEVEYRQLNFRMLVNKHNKFVLLNLQTWSNEKEHFLLCSLAVVDIACEIGKF